MASMLEDDKGNTSTVRVMSIICLLEAMVMGGWILYRPPSDPGTAIYVFSAFLIGAFAPKVMQKFIEEKMPK